MPFLKVKVVTPVFYSYFTYCVCPLRDMRSAFNFIILSCLAKHFLRIVLKLICWGSALEIWTLLLVRLNGILLTVLFFNHCL